MKQTPYQTFACTGYELEKIVHELTLKYKLDPVSALVDLQNEVGNKGFALISNLDFNPKPFAHPIDITTTDYSNTNSEISVIDTRPFTKLSKFGDLDVTKFSEYELAKRRVILHSIWRSSDRYLLQNTMSTIIPIYSAWISEGISKFLNIDSFTQLKIANIAAWWFWCQCNNEDELTDANRPRIYREIAAATRSTFEAVENDLDGLGYFDDIIVFCEEVKERTDSTRLKHFDPATVIQLCCGGWIGTWAREIMSVCIEYPPYLAAVVYTALHDRGVRSSNFSKLVQRYQTRPEMKGFKLAIDRLAAPQH